MLLAGGKLISGVSVRMYRGATLRGTCFLDVWQFEEFCKDEHARCRGRILDEFSCSCSFC